MDFRQNVLVFDRILFFFAEVTYIFISVVVIGWFCQLTCWYINPVMLQLTLVLLIKI